MTSLDELREEYSQLSPYAKTILEGLSSILVAMQKEGHVQPDKIVFAANPNAKPDIKKALFEIEQFFFDPEINTAEIELDWQEVYIWGKDQNPEALFDHNVLIDTLWEADSVIAVCTFQGNMVPSYTKGTIQ
jgi:hypothetical protein